MQLARIGKIVVCVGVILVFVGLAVGAQKIVPQVLFSVVAFGFLAAGIGFVYEFLQKSHTQHQVERQ